MKYILVLLTIFAVSCSSTSTQKQNAQSLLKIRQEAHQKY